MDKEKLRKTYGLKSRPGLVDESVVARRWAHKAIATWCSVWLPWLQFIAIAVGFFIVFLPVFWGGLRQTLSYFPSLAMVSSDYAGLKGLAMTNIYVVGVLFFLKIILSGPAWGGVKCGLAYDKILYLDAYPENLKEEVSFFVGFAFNVSAVTVWVFLPFGIFAYLAR
ncbi:MAG: hypothetical protein ACK4K3_04870 [Aquabacterium sp.]